MGTGWVDTPVPEPGGLAQAEWKWVVCFLVPAIEKGHTVTCSDPAFKILFPTKDPWPLEQMVEPKIGVENVEGGVGSSFTREQERAQRMMGLTVVGR